MKQIALNEEFSFNGRVWSFIDTDGKVTLKNIRKAGKSSPNEPPTLDEVKDYFKSKDYPEQLAVEFYEYYNVAGWKDGKGNSVNNYKQKALAVWMKPDRKIKEQQIKKESGNFLF